MFCRCPKDGAPLITFGEWECNLKCWIFINNQKKTAGYHPATWENELYWKFL